MSDPDIKDLLKKNLEVSERTLQLVEKMHRAALWARFFNLIKWAIIIGVTVWSYIAIQPYLEKALGLSQQIGGLSPFGGSSAGGQKSLPSSGGLDSLLKGFLNK